MGIARGRYSEWVKEAAGGAENGPMSADRCPSCAAAVRPDASWCSQCYADLRPAPAPAPAPPPAPPPAAPAPTLLADPLDMPLDQLVNAPPESAPPAPQVPEQAGPALPGAVPV